MSSDQRLSLFMTSLYDLNFNSLTALITGAGLPALHASSLWTELHRGAAGKLRDQEAFVPPLKRWLAEHLDVDCAVALPEIGLETASGDGLTRKLLLRMADGSSIETVVMGYPGRFTACLSTQVGCAMGCVFCATGQGGFTRHLTVGEIVSQVIIARSRLKAQGFSGLRNLVMMGMGEPFHNYEAVMSALEIITDARGINIGPSKVTVSTVGIVPGIVRMADEGLPYNLAISLHAATDESRGALLPINQRWPLRDLVSACRYYNAKTGRRLFFAWTLIEGQNDTPEDAQAVIDLLRGLDAHVNLIPLNPTDGYAHGPSGNRTVNTFQALLRSAGFPSTVRQRRGIDVAAGCGQLAGAA